MSGGRGCTLWCLYGHALAGVRVQKVQRVQRFDTAFGREGCGGRLRRQYKCRLRRRPPLVPVGTTFPPLKRWDYGYSALCHMKQQVSVERFYSAPCIGGSPAQPDRGWPRQRPILQTLHGGDAPFGACRHHLSPRESVSHDSLVAVAPLRIVFACHPASGGTTKLREAEYKMRLPGRYHNPWAQRAHQT